MSMRQPVFQDTFTLTYSVAENVALSEQWEEQKVWKCLEKAGLMQKVEALPQGLSTNLGKELSQDGVKLSGGETQKLLLARALYRDPSIILLDEPTAALDALAESEIYEIYNQTLADITALFISHRARVHSVLRGDPAFIRRKNRRMWKPRGADGTKRKILRTVSGAEQILWGRRCRGCRLRRCGII